MKKILAGEKNKLA